MTNQHAPSSPVPPPSNDPPPPPHPAPEFAPPAEAPPQAHEKPLIYPRPLIQALTHGDIAIVAVGYQPYKTNWIDHGFGMHAVGLVASGRGTYQMHGRALESANYGNVPNLTLPPPPPSPTAQAEPTVAAPTAVAKPALTPVEPGSFFTVFPGPVFTYGPTPGPAWEEYYFCAVGAGVQRWVDFGWFPTDGSVYRLSHPPIAVECYRELMRIQHRAAPGDADRAVSLAERLLIEMYHGRESVEHARRADGSVAAVLAHCQQNFTRPIDFPALASDHAMSYSSLRQRVKQVTGVPPAQYLIHLRCQKAQALLSDTDLSIKAIGAAVGIADPYAFSRTFKKCVGLAPDLYRRQTAPWARPRASAAGTQTRQPALPPAPGESLREESSTA